MTVDWAYLRWRIFSQAPYFLVVACAFSGLFLWALSQMPAKHTAQARVLVETGSLPRDLANALSAPVGLQHLQLVEARLLTQDVFRRVEQRVGGVQEVENHVRLSKFAGRDKATLLNIDATHLQADLAVAIANAFAKEAIAASKSINKSQSDEALQFFLADSRTQHQKLKIALAELDRFRERHILILPENMQHLSQDIQMLRDRIALLSDQQTQSPYALETKKLQSELSSARAVFTADHPKVKHLEMTLSHRQDPRHNPQAHRVELDGLRAKLARQEVAFARVSEIRLRYEILQRDYEFARRNYETAQASLSRAKHAAQSDGLKTGSDLTLVESAALRDGREQKKRLYASIAAILAAIGIAGCLVVFRLKTDRRVRRPRDLEHRLGVNAFATLPNLGPGLV